MFDRLIHFFKGPNLFHPTVWKGRLRPTTFRSLTPADIPQCLEIYDLNEPGRFPGGGRVLYQACLEAGAACYLVAERDARIVATGGIARTAREDVVVLSFGMVHPSHQRRGLGIALTMARIALLDPDRSMYYVFIFSVERAIDYYGRLGFVVVGSWKDEHGAGHPLARLAVYDDEIVRCRKLLKQHGVHWPESGMQLPREGSEDYPEWLTVLGLPPESNLR